MPFLCIEQELLPQRSLPDVSGILFLKTKSFAEIILEMDWEGHGGLLRDFAVHENSSNVA